MGSHLYIIIKIVSPFVTVIDSHGGWTRAVA